MNVSQVFTVGHSNHPIERFLDLLGGQSVGVVADVRSTPGSKLSPQFNERELRERLKKVGIQYVFLGTELGARSRDPRCYVDGRCDYELLAQTGLFRTGIRRVVEGTQKHRIALMCAEKDPLDCHRTILVSRRLVEEGVEIEHILSDGRIESHRAAMTRLQSRFNVGGADLFRSPQETLDAAYRQQGLAIAYVDKAGEIAQKSEAVG